MILSKEKYAVQREPIRVWLENKPDADLKKEISHIAIGTGVPIIIVVEFIMEIKGRLPELVEMQSRLMRFYGVTAVDSILLEVLEERWK